ncbi:MAG: hypothetical protein GY889_13160 [Proteobacteria bacterium]|nr:hypothetical protein [Pseudomonadota bacterium]
MAHARQQIREAVGTALTGLSTTGSNVFESRIYNFDEASLPGLNIMTTTEEVDEELCARSSSGFLLVRRLGVEVSAYVMATLNSDDQVDTICAEVETALSTDGALLAMVKELTLRSTEVELLAEAEKPIAKATLTFEAMYATLEQSPEVLA